MKRFRYDKSLDSEIIKHEEEMYLKIKSIADKYRKNFLKYNVDLEVTFGYGNIYRNENNSNRVPFISGYYCCIGVHVVKDNKQVQRYIEDEDEFEGIFDSWQICNIWRHWFHLDVWLRTDTTEIEEDIKGLLEDIENPNIIKKIDEE